MNTHWPRKNFSTVIYAICIFATGSVKATETVDGPVLNYETTAPSTTHLQRDNNDAGEWNEYHERCNANIFYPIALKGIEHTFLIPKIDYFAERRFFSNNSSAVTIPSQSVALGTGLATLVTQSTHDIALVVERYGDQNPFASIQPMTEVVGATFFKNMPTIFSDSYDTQTLVALRWRHFPHHDQFLPILGYKFSMTSGWFADIAASVNGTGGWRTADKVYTLYGGYRAVSREYPFHIETPEQQSGWISGYALNYFLGARFHIYRNLDLSCEIGAQNQLLHYFTNDGSEIYFTETKAAPSINIGLRTVFERPR